MSYGWLQPANVVKIAQKLLKMTKEDFELAYQEEAILHLANLDEILCHYILPVAKEGQSKYSAIEETEEQLSHLMRYVQYLLSLLTPEKIRTLQLEVELNETFHETLE